MKKKSSPKDISEMVLGAAEGVFGTVIDLSLWYVAYFASLGLPQSDSGAYWRAQNNADSFLYSVNYDVIKRGIAEARRRGLVEKVSKKNAAPQISSQGEKRLNSVLPIYKEKRPWDGRLHLVTYDVPEVKRKDRKILYRFLKKIGCARLQDSLWMTPHNPKEILISFVNEHALSGMIIVSDIGKDGSIGDDDVHALVVRVFGIEELNARYSSWFKILGNKTIDQMALLRFLSIVKDDPQLPFELLPSWWKGDDAYNKVKNQLRKLSSRGLSATG
ncbi:hypothetical protein HY947_01735 [Candidatus Gottesmanbacteria bacterium]|nr:hypothetical protein [Candidatus Gottesmanbacteria bacterium]